MFSVRFVTIDEAGAMVYLRFEVRNLIHECIPLIAITFLLDLILADKSTISIERTQKIHPGRTSV